MTPPVAILSPRGWEIPDDPARMFSPPTARRPREYERKFSEPAISPWQDAQNKVNNWNLPPTAEGMKNHISPSHKRFNKSLQRCLELVFWLYLRLLVRIEDGRSKVL